MKIKAKILKDLNRDEENRMLRGMIRQTGVKWIEHLLRKLKIPGRTNIVKGFRWDSGLEAEIKSAEEMLQHRPLEEWFSHYVENYSAIEPLWCVIKRGESVEVRITMEYPFEEG